MAVLAGAVGLFFGSFFGVVAHRVPEKRSIAWPPSSCPHCGHRLGVSDLIPIASFLVQRGRCRYCRARLSWRYPAIEIAAGAAFAAASLFAGGAWRVFLTAAIFFSFLLVLFVTDVERLLLPDRITLPGVAFGLALAAAGFGFVPWLDALLGGVVGYGALWVVRALSKGAMGGGDCKMLALIGTFLGPAGALYALFAASAVGTIVGGSLMLLGKHQRGQLIPFGPFLAIGAVAVVAFQRLTG